MPACAYTKRRCVPPSMTRLREGPSEVTPGRSGRVERRTAGLTGRRSFVSIHTRPTVPREPSPEVYRDVREARKSLFMLGMKTPGKGLITLVCRTTVDHVMTKEEHIYRVFACRFAPDSQIRTRFAHRSHRFVVVNSKNSHRIRTLFTQFAPVHRCECAINMLLYSPRQRRPARGALPSARPALAPRRDDQHRRFRG